MDSLEIKNILTESTKCIPTGLTSSRITKQRVFSLTLQPIR